MKKVLRQRLEYLGSSLMTSSPVRARIVAVVFCFLIPSLSFAQHYSQKSQRIALQNLVDARIKALKGASTGSFDEAWAPLIVVLPSRDPLLKGEKAFYDARQSTFFFSARAIRDEPFNKESNKRLGKSWKLKTETHQKYPLIRTVDRVLVDAILKRAAQVNDSWMNSEEACWSGKAHYASPDIAKRLPCEMIVTGIALHVDKKIMVVNENHPDLFPEDFAAFQKDLWNHAEKLDVIREKGGYALVHSLIAEFGMARAVTFFARTPFQIEHNDLRASVVAYQERARHEMGASVRTNTTT